MEKEKWITSSGARLRGLKQERYALQVEASELLGGKQPLTDAQRQREEQITARLLDINREVLDLEEMHERDRRIVLDSGSRAAGGRTYREMFGLQAATADGWRSAEEFVTAIHASTADPRLRLAHQPAQPLAVLRGGVGSEGGYAVPTEFLASWLDSSLEGEVVRPRADVIAMQSSAAVAPGWDDVNHASGTTYGGFTGDWVAEGGTIGTQTPKLRLIRLSAKKLALLAEVSIELAADGVGFDEQLRRAMQRAIGFFLDRAFLSGTGAGQPLGIIDAPCTVVVSKESGQAAATVNLQNVLKMFARMAPASLSNAVWVANSTLIPQLMSTTITVGSGGSFVPLLTESNGEFRMLTRPVIFTEKVPALGTKGDIIFADLAQYVVGLRADASIDRSMHVGFTKGTVHYRVILRGDGQPKLNAAITPVNGDTVSPFVVLETRS